MIQGYVAQTQAPFAVHHKAAQAFMQSQYISTTGKKNQAKAQQRTTMNFTTITPCNLGKISKNFSNLASAFSDDSGDDNTQGYLSSHMNLSLSPEEIHKR